MALPSFAVAVATHRLERRFLTSALMFSEIASPERALEMGFLDEVADDPLSRACSLAATLAELPSGAFAITKRRLWRGLRRDLAALEGPHHEGAATGAQNLDDRRGEDEFLIAERTCRVATVNGDWLPHVSPLVHMGR